MRGGIVNEVLAKSVVWTLKGQSIAALLLDRRVVGC